MSLSKTETLNKLRDKVLSESKSQGGKSRFGLFSLAPASVWGDGNYDFTKQKYLGPDGKVKTEPRGIYSGVTKSGKTDGSYFSKAAYISINCPYVDPHTVEKKLSKKKTNPHDASFKPASIDYSDPIKSVFKYMNSGPKEVKKNFKDENGKIPTGPRNITTNPMKEGHYNNTTGHLFSKPLPHIKDEYDRRRQLEFEQHIQDKKKLQDTAFKVGYSGNEAFNNNVKTYGRDSELPPEKPVPKFDLSKTHDAPFKPCGPTQGAFGSYPEYKANPIHQATRQKDQEKKDPFKPVNTASFIRPTPSISLNKYNLKKELASVRSSSIL